MNLRSIANLSFLSSDLAIDLGTANTLVYAKDKGIVVSEPSIVAVNKVTGKVEAVGKDAKEMLGRTPGNIVAIRPMKDGVIADFEITEKMLSPLHPQGPQPQHHGAAAHHHRHPLRGDPGREARGQGLRAQGQGLRGLPGGPGHGRGHRRRPAHHRALAATWWWTSAAAPPTSRSSPWPASSTRKSVRVAGNEMDEAIIQYIKKKYNLLIGERTAEQIKLELGSAFPLDEPHHHGDQGPRPHRGHPQDPHHHRRRDPRGPGRAHQHHRERGARGPGAHAARALAPTSWTAGIVLTGGGSLLKNLDKLLREETGLPVSVAEDPLSLGGAGDGQDALGLRPAAQDQPGLSAARDGRRWPSAYAAMAGSSRRARAASSWAGWCSPTWWSSASRWSGGGGASLLERDRLRASSPRSSAWRAARCAACAATWSRLRRPAPRARREPAAAASACASWRCSCRSSRSRSREAERLREIAGAEADPAPRHPGRRR